MSALQEQKIVCKDCEKSFLFTAAEVKEFQDKGYDNLPLRCNDCREKRRSEYEKRRHIRRRVPVAASVVADGTLMRNAKIVLLKRGYGFIEYDGGRVYFPITAYDGDASDLRYGMYVDFKCGKDDKDRIVASTIMAASNPLPVAADAAADTPAPRKHAAKAPRAKKEGDATTPVPAAARSSKPAAKDAATTPRPSRTMIDITVECPGKPTKVFQKPAERATFTVFRKIVAREHKGEISRNFHLYRGDEMLTYETFNQLKAGDVINVREVPADATVDASAATESK